MIKKKKAAELHLSLTAALLAAAMLTGCTPSDTGAAQKTGTSGRSGDETAGEDAETNTETAGRREGAAGSEADSRAEGTGETHASEPDTGDYTGKTTSSDEGEPETLTDEEMEEIIRELGPRYPFMVDPYASDDRFSKKTARQKLEEAFGGTGHRSAQETEQQSGTADTELTEQSRAGEDLETVSEAAEDLETVSEAVENPEDVTEMPFEWESITEAFTEVLTPDRDDGTDLDEAPADTAAETGEAPVYPYIPGYINMEYALFKPVTEVPLPEKNMSVLRQQLERKIANYSGTWSICVKEMDTEEELVIHDEAMPSASVLKLFIMGAVYQAIEDGELERTSELVERLNSMITASSNTAANQLFYQLGGSDYKKGVDKVNQYIQEQGYSDRTIAYNPFQDSSLTVNPGKINQTCGRDCAELLSRIYHRTLGRRKVCNEIEEMMLSQATRYKIPKAIPDSALVGNKTGETDDIENDVAIVYTPVGDYILCVFSTGWTDKKEAEARITDISAEVYAYFTDPEYVAQRYPAIRYVGDLLQ